MFQIKLNSLPDYFDEYNQPCYLLKQKKGLVEDRNDYLHIDALADGYVTAVSTTLRLWVSQQVSLAAAGRKVDMLEVGGATGVFFDWVKETACTYINIEPCPMLLDEKALERLKDSRYMCIKCSGEDIPLQDESVDIILAISSFDHIPDHRKALREIKRLLRKNGLFILTLNNRRSWWKSLLSGSDYLKKREELIAKDHYIQWSFSECESNLSQFFTIENMCTTTFFTFVPQVWRYVLPITNSI